MSSEATERDGGQAESSSNSGARDSDPSSSIVEISIRTLDSASHTIRVNKDIPVPALKEQLQALLGVPAQDQRLICRGRVLKDDQLLSAYNLEDGHTLHLVARPQQQQQSTDAQAQGEQANAQDPNQQGRSGQVTHSLLVGTINVPTVGDGGIPDFNRIVSAVLGSVGNIPGGAADMHQAAPLNLNASRLFGGSQFQVPADALTTMAIYLSRMEQMFGLASGQALNEPPNQDPNQNQAPDQTSNPSSNPAPAPAPAAESSATDQRVPPAANRPPFSPAALGGIIRRAQSLLSGQASVLLNGLAGQLENESTLTDVNMRGEVQVTAAWSGTIMQQLGALLMELGRTTMALHMGLAPTESMVNSGPAVFLSPSGPNPMMVQPMPFPPIGTFPARWPNQAPRSLNIHIHTSDVGLQSGNAPVGPAAAAADGSIPPQQQMPGSGIPAEAGQDTLGDALDGNSQGLPSAVVQETIMVIQDNGDARVLSSRSRNLTPGATTPPPGMSSATTAATAAAAAAGEGTNPPMQAASTAQLAQVSQALSQLLPGGLGSFRAAPPGQQQLGLGSSSLTSMLGATLGQLAGFQPGNYQVQAPFNPFSPPPPAPATAPLAQAQVAMPQQPASVPPPQPSPDSSTVRAQPPSIDPSPATDQTAPTPTPVPTPTPQPALNPPVGLGLGRLRPLVPRRRADGSPHGVDPRPDSSRAAPPPPQSPGENNFASLIGNIIRTPAFGNLAQQMMQSLGSEGGSPNVDIGSIMQPMLRSVIQHQQQQPPPAEAPEAANGTQGNDSNAVKESNSSEALLQKLENGESAEDLTRSVAEAAAASAGTPLNETELAELTNALKDDYIPVLSQDLASRI